MIIYNVTVNVDYNVHDEWYEWMKTKHIPDVMDTGCFRDARFSKIMAEEEGGKSYSIQYMAHSRGHLNKYLENFAPALQEEHTKKYQGKFAAFRTLLEVQEEFIHEG